MIVAKSINGVAPKTLKVAIHLASKGDQIAFETIYNAFYENLYWFFINQRKLSTENAQDLTSEVLSKVWEKASMYDPAKANLSTWIYRIAENHYIDYRRKEQTREFYFPMYKILFTDFCKADPTAFKICKQDANPHQKMVVSELREFISLLMSTKVLSKQLSDIMNLRYVEELSLKEIEKKLKVNSSTLRVSVMRAKKEIMMYVNNNFSLASQYAMIPTLTCNFSN